MPESPNITQKIKYTIAIASGKGGVGKSTVSANLALALAKSNLSVGLLDCDIYGPSIHIMFNLKGKSPRTFGDQTIEPLQSLGLHIMSMGLLASDDKPVIWRGPMVHNIIQQFLKGVRWPALDFLIVDLPPGTGDAQLSLAQQSAITAAAIVTTPQDISLIDATKGLKMFQQLNVPVIGIIENMSSFSCPHCGKPTEIFKQGGGQKLAGRLNVPFLGSVPIDPQIVIGGDSGAPIVHTHPDSSAAQAFIKIAQHLVEQTEIVTTQKPPLPDLNLKWKAKPASFEV